MQITRQWRKSSKCNNENMCVEVALIDDDAIGVRNSKRPNAGMAIFTREEWRAFAAGVAAGEFEA